MNKKQRIGLIVFFTAFILIMMINLAFAESINGVDVSNNNGYINFSDFTQNNINNIIIKATEGVDFVDVNLDMNYNKAKSLGMNVGFYHFFSNYTSPTQQAIDFWNAIKDKQFNITPVLDIETNRLGVPKSIMTQRTLEFLTKFKELSGYDCMIYSYTSFIEEDLDYYSLINYKLWIANYSSNPRFPSVWSKNYAGWQNSEDFYLNGKKYDSNIFTNLIYCNAPNNIVDINSYNINNNSINGAIAELQSLCKSNGSNITVDNIYGPQTDNAVRNLPLAGLHYKTPSPTTWIQLRLFNPCECDGIFGANTTKAVKEFQARHGLVIDGIVGRNTYKALATEDY